MRTATPITKSVSPTTYTIGQDVTYTIRVDFIEGTTPSLLVTDVLPSGLSYISHLISVGNTGISFSNPAYNTVDVSGQSVRFNLGDLTNPGNPDAGDDFITIALTARVQNIMANQDGVVLKNGEQADGSQLYLQYGAGATRLDFDADPATAGIQGVPIHIVEPKLNLTKTAAPTAVAAGQQTTFTISVVHDATSKADAYDLVLVDTLPAGLTYVAGSATLPAADVTVAGQLLTFLIASLTQTQGPLTFSYRAQVVASAIPGQSFANDVDLTWKGLSGADGTTLSGRTGADGYPGTPVLNDYAAGAAAAVSVPAPDLATTKNHTGAFYVGSNGVYTIKVQNIGAGPTTGTITVTDNLPAGLSFVSATGSGWTCGAVGQLVTCTKPGPLASGASTQITLTVNIGAAAFPTVNNTVTVNTAYDSNPKNNSDTDATTIRASLTPTATKTPTGGSGGPSPTPTGPVPTISGGTPTPRGAQPRSRRTRSSATPRPRFARRRRPARFHRRSLRRRRAHRSRSSTSRWW